MSRQRKNHKSHTQYAELFNKINSLENIVHTTYKADKKIEHNNKRALWNHVLISLLIIFTTLSILFTILLKNKNDELKSLCNEYVSTINQMSVNEADLVKQLDDQILKNKELSKVIEEDQNRILDLQDDVNALTTEVVNLEETIGLYTNVD